MSTAHPSAHWPGDNMHLPVPTPGRFHIGDQSSSATLDQKHDFHGEVTRLSDIRARDEMIRSLPPSTTTSRFFNNKRKRSSEPSPQGIFPTVPTDIAAGPVGYQAQSNIGPEDDRTGGGSRIVFQDMMDEDQELPASVVSTSGAVISETERRNSRTKEDTDDTGGRINEPFRAAKRAREGTVLRGATVHVNAAEMVTKKFSDLKVTSAEAADLNQFPRANEAEYRHCDRRGCLKGTRTTVLDEIEHWSRDFHKPPVYWLNGLAGTGKSAIAQTLAERLFAGGQLGASFFCSRDSKDRSDLRFIFPTIAVQLARKYTQFRSIFLPLARSDSGIVYESLYNQMDKLIVQPLKESAISMVIVIDALDECKGDEPVSAILSALGQFVSQIPNVKFFLTGRPEPRIRKEFRLPLLAQITDVFVLHEVELSQVNSDIRIFFKHRFSEIADRRGGLGGWPTEEQLDLLCERAGGLFVHAVATIKFIDHKHNNPVGQLDRLLHSPESSVFEEKTTFDSIYASILQEAFGKDNSRDDHKVRSVLGAVALAVNPLSPSTIATLTGCNVIEVFLRLLSVHSLLAIRQDVDRPVRPFHKSFPSFIIDPARCTNSRFRVSPPDQHTELLIGCLELMNRRLEWNMCKLPDGVMDSEINDLKERTEQYIDQALEYACRSWHKHLVETTPANTLKITSVLHRFLEGKFLFWLEVLSVLGATREAVDALEAAARWLDASPTLNLVNVHLRFVLVFSEVISTFASHIYHSALPLSPQTSIVHKLHHAYCRNFQMPRLVVSADWPPGHPVLITKETRKD